MTGEHRTNMVHSNRNEEGCEWFYFPFLVLFSTNENQEVVPAQTAQVIILKNQDRTHIGCGQCGVKTQPDSEGILCSLDHFCFLYKRDSKEHWVDIETAQSQQSASKNSPQTWLTVQKLVRTLHRNSFLLKQDVKTGWSS